MQWCSASIEKWVKQNRHFSNRSCSSCHHFAVVRAITSSRFAPSFFIQLLGADGCSAGTIRQPRYHLIGPVMLMIGAMTSTLPAVVSLKEHLRRARAARWKGKTKADKTAAASSAASAYWAKLLPEQKSEEMKRRAAVRKKNRKKKG